MAACLRRVPAGKLLAASNGLNFTPVVDGRFVPAQPQAAFAYGQFTHVPVIAGVNRNEGLPTSISTWAGFTQMVRANYGAGAGRVLASYPRRDFPSATVAAGAVVSDQMVCSALTATTRLARWVPVYMYRWDDVTEPFYFTNTPAKGNILAGAYHSAELTALFPGWALPPAPQLTTPDQTAIISTAMTYWGAFARDGRPTTSGALPWPAYQRGESVMSLRPAYDSEILHAADLRQTHHCALWDTIPSLPACRRHLPRLGRLRRPARQPRAHDGGELRQ
jgi:para-nitrobenzyl esterase